MSSAEQSFSSRERRGAPEGFALEATTVWSFPERGAWATHDGGYRGNWSPYVPRNLILRYSGPGDLVVDPFVGGGATAIEAKLLGRRCLALDLNPAALATTRNHLRFPLPLPEMGGAEPELARGDALRLPLGDGSVDLLCLHPPYADAIRYSDALSGDLSHLQSEAFLTAMDTLAQESRRVLAPGGVCALLIGDLRRRRHVVPLGFATLERFLDTGLVLGELAIKQQHHTAMAQAWAARSRQQGFLLLAHEYLAVFRNSEQGRSTPETVEHPVLLPFHAVATTAPAARPEAEQTTTVWPLPAHAPEAALRRALWQRFAPAGSQVLDVTLGQGRSAGALPNPANLSLITLRLPDQLARDIAHAGVRADLTRLAAQAVERLPSGGTLAVTVPDVRRDGALAPLGLLAWHGLRDQAGLALTEIAVLLPDSTRRPRSAPDSHLQIAHRYLLVFRRRDAGRPASVHS